MDSGGLTYTAAETAALREVAALAAAAAHEINNPLTILQGNVELASGEIRDRERVDHIRDAVRRITEIFGRMARITRLERNPTWLRTSFRCWTSAARATAPRAAPPPRARSPRA